MAARLATLFTVMGTVTTSPGQAAVADPTLTSVLTETKVSVTIESQPFAAVQWRV